MRYEIEILDGNDVDVFHQNLSIGQVKDILSEIGENREDKIEKIIKLQEWESILLGNCLVTKCGSEENSSFMQKGETKEIILAQMTLAFWEAMEENERGFKEYLATNPTPFEKMSAQREYNHSKRENEIKYMELISSMEDGALHNFLSSFSSANNENQTKYVGE